MAKRVTHGAPEEPATETGRREDAQRLEGRLAFNGRRVAVYFRPEWVRVEGLDLYPVTARLRYQYSFSLYQVSSVEASSAKPTETLYVAAILLALAGAVYARLDALAVRLVLDRYSLAPDLRLGIVLALAAVAMAMILTYAFTTTSTLELRLNTGEKLSFYGTPRAVELFRSTLGRRLGFDPEPVRETVPVAPPAVQGRGVRGRTAILEKDASLEPASEGGASPNPEAAGR